MDKAKVDHEEPQYAEIMNKTNNAVVVKSELNKFITGGFKAERLKSLILEWTKAENLRSSLSSQSPLSRFKLLALVAFAMLILLTSAILLEFTAISETMRPKLLSLRSSHLGLFGPSESKCNIYMP